MGVTNPEATLTGTHEVSGNNPIYQFKAISPVANKQTQTVIAVPFINTSPSNTILFRFSGKQEEISFDFMIFEDAEDTANGTAPTNSDFPDGVVKTVQEQILWLKNYMFNEDYDTTWTLVQQRFYGITVPTGVITNLEFNNDPGAVSVVTGKFTFKLGNIGGL